jgi:competence ComEA-like helix-hairpin-helix protein
MKNTDFSGNAPERPSCESAADSREPSDRRPRAAGLVPSFFRDPLWAPLIRKACLGALAICGVALLGMQAPSARDSAISPAKPSAPEAAPEDRDQAAAMPIPPAPVAPTPLPPCRPTVGANLPAEPKVIGLNSATLAELDSLPGVGPKKAEEILKLRARLGKFKKVTDVLRVRGISAKTLQNWKGLVAIDEPKPPEDPKPTEVIPRAPSSVESGAGTSTAPRH